MDDPTGYNMRRAERNHQLLEEILGEIKIIKREIKLLRQNQSDINKKWELINKREIAPAPASKGWFY